MEGQERTETSQEKKYSERKPQYFKEALADFTHDMACGGAIRHMADKGYSIEQIIRQLDFPTPRSRVERIYMRHLLDSGVLCEQLPVGETGNRQLLSERRLFRKNKEQLRKILQTEYEKNGTENSYVVCPYGTWHRDREARLEKAFRSLTGREREYLLGLPLEQRLYYHRLDSRMYEISMQLAIASEQDMHFFYLRSGEHIHICE